MAGAVGAVGTALLVGLAIVLLLVLAIRAVWRGRGSVSSGMGDGLGTFIDVFDPGQARAARDLKQHDNAGPVSRIPDDEDDDPILLLRHPDGTPRAVRIRRPARDHEPAPGASHDTVDREPGRS